MGYTFKVPYSSSTRFLSPQASPQMIQWEESHSLCQAGQGGPEDSSSGDRVFCCAPTAWSWQKGWHTKWPVQLSSHKSRLCPCRLLLRFEKTAWFLHLVWLAPLETCHECLNCTDLRRNRSQLNMERPVWFLLRIQFFWTSFSHCITKLTGLLADKLSLQLGLLFLGAKNSYNNNFKNVFKCF